MIAPLWTVKPAFVDSSTTPCHSSSAPVGAQSVEIYFPSHAGGSDSYRGGIRLKFDSETGECLPGIYSCSNTVNDVC